MREVDFFVVQVALITFLGQSVGVAVVTHCSSQGHYGELRLPLRTQRQTIEPIGGYGHP